MTVVAQDGERRTFSLLLADAPLASANGVSALARFLEAKTMSRFGRNNHSGKHSDEANRWYGLGWWKKRRLVQLRKHPLCAICLEQYAIVTPATVVDHVDGHGGDWQRFRFGRLQSLCAPCHDSIKRTVEQRGYSTAIGLDGWPIDPKHPAYQGTKGIT